MLRIIKAETYKLFKSSTFKVLSIVAMLIIAVNIIMSIVMTEEFLVKMTGMEVEELEQIESTQDDLIVSPGKLGFTSGSIDDNPDVDAYEIFNISYGAGIIEIVIVVLVGAMVAKEYSQGTIKNMLAYGEKRYQFYLSKFIANLIGTTIILAIITVGSTVGLAILNGWGTAFEISQILNMAKVFMATLVVYAATVAVAMLFSTVLKSNGATISIAIILFDFLPVTTAFFYGKNKIFDRVYESTLYYNAQLTTSFKATNSDILVAIGISVAWIIITLGMGIYVFNRQEIK